MSKQDASNAERAAEWYARDVLGCVVTRRAIRTRFQKVDFMGADILAKREDGSTVWIQVTASKTRDNVSHRKRKLEAIPWNVLDGVYLLQMRREKIDGRVMYFFRVEVLVDYEWQGGLCAPIPRAWFKACRRDL